MWAPQLRLAKPRDGARLQALLKDFGYAYIGQLDWSNLTPDWILAEAEGELVGAVQVVLSRPLGYVHFLATAPALPHRRKAQLVKALGLQAALTLQSFGAQMAGFFVTHDRKNWKRLLKRRNCKIIGTGHMMAGFLGGPDVVEP